MVKKRKSKDHREADRIEDEIENDEYKHGDASAWDDDEDDDGGIGETEDGNLSDVDSDLFDYGDFNN